MSSVEIGEGDLTVTATGDLVFDDVQLLSVNRDAVITTAGAVSGIVNSTVDIRADQLTIAAANGITTLAVQANELLSVVTTAGDIDISNTAFTNAYDTIANLTVTEVRADAGSVSIENDGTIVAHHVEARGADGTLQLISTGANIIVCDPQGGTGFYAGSAMELDAAVKLDLEVQVDAEDSLILRTGERFALATTAIYAADIMIVESDATIEMSGNLVFGGTSIEMSSGRKILLDGTISSSDGSTVESLSLTSLAANPQEIPDTDPVFGYKIYHDGGGNVVLKDANDKYYRTEINGMYVQSGLDVPASGSAPFINYLSVNEDGTGNLFELDGITPLDATRVIHLNPGIADVTSDFDEPAKIATLTQQVRYEANSDIVVDLGSQIFGATNITAGGPRGTITLAADQNLDLTNSVLLTTGDLTVTTTGTLNLAAGSISGYEGNLAEFITLTSGGNMIVDTLLAVEDGIRTTLEGDYDVEGTITLSSGGSIATNTTGVIVTGTNLLMDSVTGIDLLTNVDSIEATVCGAGTVQIVDDSSLVVESVSIQNGDILISAQGTLSAVDLRIATDAEGNVVSLSNGAGDITAGFIDAGRNSGEITIFAEAGIWEIQPDDPDVDIIAKTFNALTPNDTTDLEWNADTVVVGIPDDLVLEYYGDLVMSGDYVGTVDVMVHGDLYLDALSAGDAITLLADNAVIIQGSTSSTGGLIDVTGDGISFTATGSLSGTTLSLDATTGGCSMEGASSLTSTSGEIEIDAEDDIVLTSVVSADVLDVVSTAGGISTSVLTSSVGNTIFTAPGVISLDAMTVGGNLTVTGGASISLVDNAMVTGSAVIAGVDIDVADGAAISSSTLTLNSGTGALTMGTDASLTSTIGDITITSIDAIILEDITSANDLFVNSSAGSITVNGSFDNTRMTDMESIGIELAAGSAIDSNTMDIDATTGTFIMGTGSSLTSSAAMVLASDGAMTLATLNAGNLNASSGDALVLNKNVTVTGSLVINGDSLTISENVAVQGGSLDLDATAGGITMAGGSTLTSTTGNSELDATGDIVLTSVVSAGTLDVTSSSGSISTSVLTSSAGDSIFTSPGLMSLNATTVGGDLTVTGGNVVTFNDDATFDGNAAVTGVNIDINADVVLSANALILDGTTGDVTMSAGSSLTSTVGDTTIYAAGDIELTTVSSGEDLNITSGSGSVTTTVQITSAGDTVIDATGTVDIATTDVGGALNVSSGQLIHLTGDVTVSDNVVLTGVGITLGSTVDLKGSALNLNAGTGSLIMGANSTINSIGGGTVLTVSGNILLSMVNTAGDLEIVSSAGAILDNSPDETLNAAVLGNLLMSAACGIGVESGEDMDVDVAGSTSAAVGIGGANIDSNSNLVVNASGMQATAGAIFLKTGIGDLVLDGNVQTGNGRISLDVAGSIDLNGSKSILSSNGGGISMTARGGEIVLADGTTVTSATDSVTLEAHGNVALSRVTAQGDTSVTSHTGTISDNTAVESANIFAGGQINLTAAAGIGLPMGEDVDIRGDISAATSAGGVSIEDIGDLHVVSSGVYAGSGDILLESDGHVIIDATIHAADGDAAINGNTVRTNSRVQASSVGVVAREGNDITNGGLIFAGENVDISGTEINQEGTINTTGNGDITVTSTLGSINLSGQTVAENSDIYYTSARSMSIRSIATGGSVHLNALGGSIHDISADRSVNVTANTVKMTAHGPIGNVHGDAFDLNTDYVSAFSGSEGIHLRFLNGATVVNPGIWGMGDGDVYIFSDRDTIIHGGPLPGATSQVSGNFIGTVGMGNVYVYDNWDDREAIDEHLVRRLAENQSDAREIEATRDDADIREENDIIEGLFPGGKTLLSEVFSDPSPSSILDGLFDEAHSDPMTASETSLLFTRTGNGHANSIIAQLNYIRQEQQAEPSVFSDMHSNWMDFADLDREHSLFHDRPGDLLIDVFSTTKILVSSQNQDAGMP